MLISKPNITENNGKLKIAVTIKTQNVNEKVLWYSMDKKYKRYISEKMDSFVIALLPMAMSIGEDIVIDGLISSELSYKIKLYQGYYNFFFKSKLKIININAKGYVKNKNRKKATLCAFSGGVDSFYTLLNNLNKKNNPYYQITDLLFIEGFDSHHNNESHFSSIRASYGKLATKLNLNLISMSSNIKEVLEPYVDWGEISHGAVLASFGLILDKYVARFYIPSTFDYGVPFAWGSNPVTDPLLGTEDVHIIHHGAGKTRMQKLEYISKYPITYKYLRVCWEKQDGLNNCCMCDKCIRTMVGLKLINKLSNYSTFLKKVNRRKVRNWRINTKSGFYFSKEILTYAQKVGDENVVYDVKRAIRISKTRNFISMVFFQPLYKISYKLKKKVPAYKKLISLVKT